MRWLSILSVILLLMSVCAYADDGFMGSIGGSAEQILSSKIRMVREDVDAKLLLGKDSRNYAHVRCRFVFKNNGPAIGVRMGFPEKGETYRNKSTLKNFRSSVNGKPVKTKFIIGSKHEFNRYYYGWHVKDVYFDKGETKIVIDEYDCLLGGDISGSRSFSYILKSGKTWDGTIGKAVITVDLGDYASVFNVKSYTYKINRRVDNKLIWNLTEIEPEEDIGLTLTQKVG
ncbi:MAG: hypothetical protein ACYC0V_17310, partial [Armatimonadota bacterium]